MVKYKLLHVPTGHYLKDGDGMDVIYGSLKRLNEIIALIINKHGINWNDYNKDIGDNIIESEFEIIKIGK